MPSIALSQALPSSPPQPLNINALTDWGEDDRPRVASDGFGNWVAVWASQDSLSDTVDGFDYDIFVSRSSDHGETWTHPEALNSDATTDGGTDDWSPKIATDYLGNWLVAWSRGDGIAGVQGRDIDILLARSVDNGVTWTAPISVNPDADIDTGSDDLYEILTDGDGTWMVVWSWLENQSAAIAGDRDVYVSRSLDLGDSWSVPLRLNTNFSPPGTYWQTNESMSLASNGADGWMVTWSQMSNESVVCVYTEDDGVTWAAPLEITSTSGFRPGSSVAYDYDGGWIVSVEDQDELMEQPGARGVVRLYRSADSGSSWSTLSPDFYPPDGEFDILEHTLSVAPDGALVVAWTTPTGDDIDIWASYSRDRGLSWSVPGPLNSNWIEDGDEADDRYPFIANDGNGNWVAVWEVIRGIGMLADAGDALTSRWVLRKQDGGSDSCFIATAAYGTPLASELKSLRQFRDVRLMQNSLGSEFVDAYYRLSPSLAEYVAARPVAKSLVRFLLALLTSLPGIATFLCGFTATSAWWIWIYRRHFE